MSERFGGGIERSEERRGAPPGPKGPGNTGESVVVEENILSLEPEKWYKVAQTTSLGEGEAITLGHKKAERTVKVDEKIKIRSIVDDVVTVEIYNPGFGGENRIFHFSKTQLESLKIKFESK